MESTKANRSVGIAPPQSWPLCRIPGIIDNITPFWISHIFETIWNERHPPRDSNCLPKLCDIVRCDSVARFRCTCPNCGGAIKQQDSVPWTNVARVANLAEAGFLADELVGLGIEARIHQSDDFNALNDRWTSLYLIQVPSEHAEDAAAQIQRHRDDDVRNQR